MSDSPMTETVVFNLAEELNGGSFDDMVTGHKFADKLSAALWIITGHGIDDDSISDEDHGTYVVRYDRFILLSDSQGFVNCRVNDNVQHARWAMDDIRRDMND